MKTAPVHAPMKTAHAPIGGSIAERIIACPGSLTAPPTTPRTSTGAADRGSMLHEVVIGLQQGKWERPEDAIGYTAFGQTLTQADAKSAALPAWRAVQQWSGAHPVRYEQRVHFRSIKDAFGTADVLAHDGVLDLKFGTKVVSVKDNAQLLFYLAAALESKRVKKRDVYRLAIVQPTAPKTLQPTTTTHTQVRHFTEKLKRAVDNAYSGKPDFKGGNHCFFCPARQGCKSRLNYDFAGLGLANLKLNVA